MRCHTCEIDEYRESVEDRIEAMDDGEVERIKVTILDCPTCHAQAISYPANLLKRHAAALCFRPQRLSPASIAWLRKHMGWTQKHMGQRLGGAALNTIYRWEAGASPMPATSEFLLRLLAAVHFKLPVQDVAAALNDVVCTPKSRRMHAR